MSSGSSNALSIAPLAEEMLDVAKQFFQRLGQRKLVRHEATLHEFEEKKWMLPNFGLCCSQCDHFIILGEEYKNCKQCKLIGHEKCLNSLRFKCAYSPNAPRPKHRFMPTRFKKFTYCKHCGSLLKGIGIEPQGLSCKKDLGGCGISIHKECRDRVCRPCRLIEETKSYADVSMRDFDLIERLGSGSFSEVYLVRMKSNGKKFALKVVEKSAIANDPESANTEMRVLHFGRYHPFLPLVHCCFQTEERLCFVMEHIDGDSLLVYLRKGKFTENRTRFYSAEIVLALNFLHNKGLIYRDLKLENVIIGRDGHCKLTDFGMSKFLDQSVDMKTRTFCGTPYYMSPEMIKGLDYSFPCDWWALGVLMYELLAGFSPFNAEDVSDHDAALLYKMILEETLSMPNIDLAEETKSVLEGLLTKEPEKRLGWATLKEHPFFLFNNTDGSREHLWDAIEQKKIKPPSMPVIDKTNKPTYEPPHRLINDVKTIMDPSDPFSDFTYCSGSFQSLLGISN